jgi:hypothetical protein
MERTKLSPEKGFKKIRGKLGSWVGLFLKVIK